MGYGVCTYQKIRELSGNKQTSQAIAHHEKEPMHLNREKVVDDTILSLFRFHLVPSPSTSILKSQNKTKTLPNHLLSSLQSHPIPSTPQHLSTSSRQPSLPLLPPFPSLPAPQPNPRKLEKTEHRNAAPGAPPIWQVGMDGWMDGLKAQTKMEKEKGRMKRKNEKEE